MIASGWYKAKRTRVNKTQTNLEMGNATTLDFLAFYFHFCGVKNLSFYKTEGLLTRCKRNNTEYIKNSR